MTRQKRLGIATINSFGKYALFQSKYFEFYTHSHIHTVVKKIEAK